MACIRCGGPETGEPLCRQCEAAVEHEQNLDDEREPGRPVAPGYLDLGHVDAYRDTEAEQAETPVARVVRTTKLRALEQAREVESRQVADEARPSSSGGATAADPGPARTLPDHHKGTEAA